MMKKIISVILLIGIVLSFASCAINKDGEVSVLWSDLSDEFLFTVSDALDRGMYIENINYKHYDAKGSASTQLEQADAAIANGASALVVNAASLANATAIFAKAKAANIPLVFLCCNVSYIPSDLIATYDKCVVVDIDSSTLVATMGDKIAADLLAKYEDYDRDSDGKISYAAFGTSAVVVSRINEKLTEAGKPELVLGNALWGALPTVAVEESIDAIFSGFNGEGNEKTATPVELILTDDDAYIEELLLAMRDYELNFKKLVTHYIPLYTVGIAANAGDLIDSEVQEERDAFSVMNAIDKGYLSAAALEDDDEIALSVAKILRNFIKGNDKMKDVKGDYVDGVKVLVPYTVYGK